jgi:hypothetical protein
MKHKTSPLNDKDHLLLEKLEALLAGHSEKRDDLTNEIIFDEQEREIVRKMIKLWVALTSLGMIGGFLKNLFLYVAIILGGYYATKAWFFDVVKEAVEK